MALGKPTFVKGPVSSEKKVSGFASRTISCFSPKVACLSCFFGAKFGDVPDQNKMKPTNPNAHTYVNGTDVNTHGYAVTHNTFLQ